MNTTAPPLRVLAPQVIGLPGDGSVLKYSMDGKSTSSVRARAAAAQTLSATSLETADGATSMEFSKLLVEAGERTIAASGKNVFLFAVGSGDALGMHRTQVVRSS